MRGSRVLLIVGLILIIGALAVGAIFVMQSRRGVEKPVEPVGEGVELTPVPEVDVIVATLSIPRNTYLGEDAIWGDAPAVMLARRPQTEVPEGALTSLDNVYGRVTRVDIEVDDVILASMLKEPTGSDASRLIPEDGTVAYALPVARYSSVAWALQPGDRVDVIISLLMLDLDEEFQTALPNEAGQLTCDPECETWWRGKMGRLEVLPTGLVVMVAPGEEMARPRLVTQLTVQNALVLRVGDWPVFGEAPEEEVPVEEEGEEQEEAIEEEVTPSVPEVAPLTLAVSPQDAIVLDYAQLTGAHITLVLRKAGDEVSFRTDSVTLEYLMSKYSIEMPPKLPYGVEPRVIPLATLEPEKADEGGEALE